MHIKLNILYDLLVEVLYKMFKKEGKNGNGHYLTKTHIPYSISCLEFHCDHKPFLLLLSIFVIVFI